MNDGGFAWINLWAESVLHVLAHATATAPLASSLHSATWIAYAQRCLGPASSRPLGEDAALLERIVRTDEALSRAQLLAWLFRSPERATSLCERTLDELTSDDVDRPELLASLRGPIGTAVEVLRAAAELEWEALAGLPSLPVDERALASAVERLVPIAPKLVSCNIELARPLGIRGRLFEDTIWVGVPNEELGVSIEHVSMQAAHEATVREVVEEGVRGYQAIEREAIRRLAARARQHGLSESHRRWIAHFRVP